MNVLAHVHMYVPKHNAGAEWMLHSILRDFVRKGHQAKVIVTRGDPSEFQGVESRVVHEWKLWIELYEWADVVITHLDETRSAMRTARWVDKPLVHLVHNDKQLEANEVDKAELVVFNSSWLAKEVRWPGLAVVVHPPVFSDDYRTTPGKGYTLINLSLSKGADTFYDLARRFPERIFNGVRGAYDHQVIPIPRPPNVRVFANSPDIRAIYARTKVLLMPSDYESWGRVAIEAAASGIPTIAHPTLGLQEALGGAGIFCHRDRVDLWERAIRKLDDPAEYAVASHKALERSAQLDPTADLAKLESMMEALY